MTIVRAFGRHSDALKREEVKSFLIDVHRQTQGHSQLVTGGRTTTREQNLSAFLPVFRSRRSSLDTYPRPILTVY
jgi:hypothetical protein